MNTENPAPVETAAEAAPQEAPAIEDPLAAYAAYEEQPNPAEEFSPVIDTLREEVRNTVNESLRGFQNQNQQQEARPEADKYDVLNQKIEALQQQLQRADSNSQIQKQVDQSQQIVNGYVSNITSTLFNAGLTPENDPLLYRAMNSELTAAVTVAENRLGRPLKPQETVKLLRNFDNEWKPVLEQRGVGKPVATNTQSLSPMKASFGQPQQRMTDNQQTDMVKKIQETDSLDDLIKMGIRPTRTK